LAKLDAIAALQNGVKFDDGAFDPWSDLMVGAHYFVRSCGPTRPARVKRAKASSLSHRGGAGVDHHRITAGDLSPIWTLRPPERILTTCLMCWHSGSTGPSGRPRGTGMARVESRPNPQLMARQNLASRTCVNGDVAVLSCCYGSMLAWAFGSVILINAPNPTGRPCPCGKATYIRLW